MAADSFGESAPPAAAADRTQGLVVFTARRQRFALRIEHVREILTLDRVTPIFHVAGFIRGVTNLRGQVVAVCDLIDFLGLGRSAPAAAAPSAIVLTHAGRDLLAIIESVPEVLWTSRTWFNPPPATLPDSVRIYLETVVQEPGQQPVAVLDTPRLLADERWEQYRG